MSIDAQSVISHLSYKEKAQSIVPFKSKLHFIYIIIRSCHIDNHHRLNHPCFCLEDIWW